MEGIARVLTFGAQKYEERNWEKGMNYSRLYRAAFGHMNKWWAGIRNDHETGIHELLHAGCSIMMLYHYEATRTGRDDRPIYGLGFPEASNPDHDMMNMEDLGWTVDAVECHDGKMVVTYRRNR
jgi:hypothetical protein